MNKIGPSILFTLLLVSIAAADINLDTTDIAETVLQTDTFEATINVSNTGAEEEFDFIISDLEGPVTITADTITVSPALQTLATGDWVDVTITLTVDDDQAVGDYTGTFEVVAENDSVVGTASIKLTVESNNNAPTFDTSAPLSAIVNVLYSYDAEASDVDGDTLIYGLVQGPTGMAVNSETGEVTWTPTAAGSDFVNISVTDGEATVYQTWTIITSNPGSSLSLTAIELGSNNQERDEKVTTTATLTNTGSETISNILYTNTLASEYELAISSTLTTLLPGQTATLTIEVFVPLDQDADRHDIGTLTIAGNDGAVSVTGNVFLTTENNLIIDRVEITIAGKSNRLDEDESDDIKPGDEVEIEVTVENLFSESSNIEIQDVEITIENDDLDWDEDDNVGDIKEDDQDTFSFDFEVDYDVDEDDGPFEIEITVEGEDDNGAFHSDRFTFELDLDKERDEFDIIDLRFIPSVVDCDDTSVRLDVTIANIGRDDQDNGAIEVDSDEFGYTDYAADIELEEAEEITEQFIIPLNNPNPGQYFFDVEAYTSSNNDDLTDVEVAELTILSCGSTSSSSSSSSDTTSTTTTTPTTTTTTSTDTTTEPTVIEVVSPTTTQGQIVSTSVGRPTFVGSDSTYIVVLSVVIVLLIILIVLLLAVAFKK